MKNVAMDTQESITPSTEELAGNVIAMVTQLLVTQLPSNVGLVSTTLLEKTVTNALQGFMETQDLGDQMIANPASVH